VCYWARLGNFSRADIDDILANDNDGGPTIVDSTPTDHGFTSTRCGGWAKVE